MNNPTTTECFLNAMGLCCSIGNDKKRVANALFSEAGRDQDLKRFLKRNMCLHFCCGNSKMFFKRIFFGERNMIFFIWGFFFELLQICIFLGGSCAKPEDPLAILDGGGGDRGDPVSTPLAAKSRPKRPRQSLGFVFRGSRAPRRRGKGR